MVCAFVLLAHEVVGRGVFIVPLGAMNADGADMERSGCGGDDAVQVVLGNYPQTNVPIPARRRFVRFPAAVVEIPCVFEVFAPVFRRKPPNIAVEVVHAHKSRWIAV